MPLWELLLLAIGLAMDAFSVAICKGMAMGKASWGKSALVGLWFGFFQALMPLLGFLLGDRFAAHISRYDHWIIFVLLGIIGFNMIREALDKNEKPEESNADLSFKTMLMLSIATSIDALGAGVSLSLMEVHIIPAVSLIGVITFAISCAGVWIGSLFGTRFKSKAEILGGVILILLGLRILITHMMQAM